tara:strand:+ start:2916 stop:3980 length:1065 start_codon:yes stop_codon:yes gene_type:complete
MNVSKIHSHISGRNARSFTADKNDAAYKQLGKFAIGLDGMSFDAAPVSPLGTASIPTPNQMLQTWLPGFVAMATAPVKIDEILGLTAAGNWADEEVVQKTLEHVGEAKEYGDNSDTHLASWNVNYVRRGVVRFEEGFRVGKLEEARSSAIDINSASEKRAAAVMSLNIQRNKVGFLGYNSTKGTNIYGLLNDPSLPAYESAAATWAASTAEVIYSQIKTALSLIRTVSKDLIDPTSHSITLACATAVVDQLNKTNQYGISVYDLLAKNYPQLRIVSAPQFDAADGGANVAYFIADTVVDGASTDGNQAIVQIVPSRYQLLGSEVTAKGYTEAATNATAGVMVKRPYAVQRLSGI